jgi:hypothetical protein
MRLRIVIAAALALLTSRDLTAQGRFAFDLRAGVAAPTSTFAGADLSLGLGLGGALALSLNDHMQLYSGWDWLSFRVDRSFAGDDRQFEETGYTFGLRHDQPFSPIQGGRWFELRVEAGGTYKHIEVENTDGDIIASSDHAAGFELGVGAVSLKSGQWRFTPMIRYRSTPSAIVLGGTRTGGRLRYVGLEVGLSRAF